MTKSNTFLELLATVQRLRCGTMSKPTALYAAGIATPRSARNPLFLGQWFQDEVIIGVGCPIMMLLSCVRA
jgi:hypothetical protein